MSLGSASHAVAPRQAKDLFNQFVSGLGKCMSNLLLRMLDVVVMHLRVPTKKHAFLSNYPTQGCNSRSTAVLIDK